jgi:hypothetical protein
MNDLLTNPWLHVIGDIAAAITIFGGLLSALRYIQSRSLPRATIQQEDEYLSGLQHFVRDLNVRADFNETLFVERTLTVKNKYEPRSFFLAKHQSLLSKLAPASAISSRESIEGYHTKSLLSEVLRAGEPIIILGDPGTGKSVSARQLVAQIAARSLHSKHPNRLLPVLISLGEYVATDTLGAPLDFYQWLRDTLSKRDCGRVFSTEFFLANLDRLLDSGRILFVLDSLDEMPPNAFIGRCERITDFMLRYGVNSFLVTCRSNDFAGTIHGREAQLDRLTLKEIRTFVARRRSLLSQLTPGEFYHLVTAPSFSLRQAIDNPFYLSLIIYFYSIKGLLPDNYPLLLREICRDWGEREAKKQLASIAAAITDPEIYQARKTQLTEQILSGLSAVGFAVSNSSGFGTFIDIQFLKETVWSLGVSDDTLAAALTAGEHGKMLDVDTENGRARFIHHKFQEYFAAEFLNKGLSSGVFEYSSLATICDNIWWEEVTTILSAIVAAPEELVCALCVDGERNMNKSAEPSSVGSRFGYTRGDDKDLHDRRDPPEEANSRRSVEHRYSKTIFRRNLWLSARCVQMISRDSAQYRALLDRVLHAIRQELAKDRAELTAYIDAIRALGEIDTDAAAQLLTKYLTSRSALLRELSLSCLGKSEAGRIYLDSHVHEIAINVYFRGRFLSRAGGYAKSDWAAAFPGRRSRLVIAFYAVLARVIRAHAIAATLGSIYLWRGALLQNSYGLAVGGIIVAFDIALWLTSRSTPSVRKVFLNVLVRAWIVTLIACWSSWGLFDPPWLVLPSLVGLVVTCLGVPILLVDLLQRIFRGKEDRPSPGLLAIFIQSLKTILRKFLGKEDMELPENLELNMVTGGITRPDEYTATLGLEQVHKLLYQMETLGLGGHEIELFESLRARERKLLQDRSSPVIFSLESKEVTVKMGTKAQNANNVRDSLELFASYCHRDQTLRDELAKHLRPLEREGALKSWCDRRIGPGSEFDKEIDRHLSQAAIILLLISPDFLASEYCYSKEMLKALSRHETGEAVVIPIILRPSDWKAAPFGKLLALPTDGKPVTSWSNVDEAFLNVVQGIRQALLQMSP